MYIALTEDDSEEYDILRLEGDEENMELAVIEDDAEYNTIADLIDARLSELEGEEEDES